MAPALPITAFLAAAVTDSTHALPAGLLIPTANSHYEYHLFTAHRINLTHRKVRH
jgi:hypothetical protein